jgi:hypothetical protein
VLGGAIFVIVTLVGGDSGPKAADAASKSIPSSAVESHLKGYLKGLPPMRHPPGHPNAVGSRMPNPFPAELLRADPGSYFSSELIHPLTNAWRAASHSKMTAVDAGGEDRDSANGVFGIFRENYRFTSQKENIVRVVGSGPVTITKAPEGRGKVQTWAQRRGDLHFTSTSGVTGVLHLKNDTVTVTP